MNPEASTQSCGSSPEPYNSLKAESPGHSLQDLSSCRQCGHPDYMHHAETFNSTPEHKTVATQRISYLLEGVNQRLTLPAIPSLPPTPSSSPPAYNAPFPPPSPSQQFPWENQRVFLATSVARPSSTPSIDITSPTAFTRESSSQTTRTDSWSSPDASEVAALSGFPHKARPRTTYNRQTRRRGAVDKARRLAPQALTRHRMSLRLCPPEVFFELNRQGRRQHVGAR
ncbi:hypothetical protein FH972_024054 [Carpinus fangiana]|uniref:Uncharacterized protein n=1 Tax=Carpinus fangiana TaxID=176857 RepID=A0A5N6KXC1_9ROSI|nr:hypothetical protein FH972_024054 [Carpinus fangiana]